LEIYSSASFSLFSMAISTAFFATSNNSFAFFLAGLKEKIFHFNKDLRTSNAANRLSSLNAL
jgi:hypothetical protein